MTVILWWVALALPLGGGGDQDPFTRVFTGHTLRVDCIHAGTSGEEHLCLQGLRLEGEWAGSRTRPIDELNLGEYYFELVDVATNRVIYTRGLCSVYGEWETTGEARDGLWRGFQEALRFPEPRLPSQMIWKKRGPDGMFHEIFSCRFDPGSRFVDRSPISPRGTLWTLFENAPVARALDLLILGDGYTAGEQEKYRADVERLTGRLFATEPFAGRRGDFNVRALFVPAARSGISNPRLGLWRDAPLGTRFNSFDSDRYVLVFAERRLREIAAQAPYDALLIVCNSRKYGGGGVFNQWATCTADSSASGYVFVHEFGHSLAGLADEYYASQVAYEEFAAPGVEPWEPNITALIDPARLKWKDLTDAGTPVPTPWNQAAYDEEASAYQAERVALRERGAGDDEVEALFARNKEVTSGMFANERYAGKVGAFEGAAYQARGLYRPCVDCIMFTRNPERFCPVCRRAIERAIDLYTR